MCGGVVVKKSWTLGLWVSIAGVVAAACTTAAAPTPTATRVPTPTVPAPTSTVEAPSPTNTAPPAIDSGTTTPAPTSTAADGQGQTGTPNPSATATSADASTGDTPTASAKYAWGISTVDDNGAKPSLSIGPDGVPQISFILEAMPGFVKHAVLNGDGWDTSTVATGYFYGPLDLYVDAEGVPHISWHNHDAQDEGYAVFNDGRWDVQAVAHPGHDGWDNNIAVDSSGYPRTVSIDPSQFGSSSGVEYAAFDGASWTVESVGSGPTPYEFGTGIALDSGDRPHVVWFDSATSDLKYAIRDNSEWTISTVDSEGDVGRYPFIALDANENPIVTYYEALSATSGNIKVARWNGSAWSTERIGSLDSVFTGFLGARKTSSLVLDADGNPIVAFSDEQVVKIAWWDGATWNVETAVTAQANPLGQQVTLDIDADGVLHLTYADVSQKSAPGVKGSVMYARGLPQ